MNKAPAWSYTALTGFETCPLRFYLTRVSKEVQEPESEELRWGSAVHKAMERRLRGESPLPPHLEHHEGLVEKFTSRTGKRLVEAKLAVDASFRPVKWYDKTVWCRGVVDVGVVGTDVAVLGDWKTGKRKPDTDQLKLFAALVFAHEQYLKKIFTVFLWLKEKKLDRDTFTREQVGDLWGTFLPRVKRFELAHQDNKWAPKPSGLCGKWCPVTKKHCMFGR